MTFNTAHALPYTCDTFLGVISRQVIKKMTSRWFDWLWFIRQTNAEESRETTEPFGRCFIDRPVCGGEIKAITPYVVMMAVSCRNIIGGNAALVTHAAHDLMC